MIKELAGNEYLYFDQAVEVKMSPHSFPFHAWAVCVSPSDELYMMDAEEQWHQLTAADDRAALVVGSLYQRLKLMQLHHYRKAS
jgi:hypothetical protein